MAQSDDQQFCLRWNNFQANITSQFETLRDDEDFTDVTIACDGQRLQAHKVVLSACSPFFKDLFKANPCSHPIIFMRDVEAQHIVALMEFMYAGEVNVAQAHLSTFLKTAESLKIRGLTDTSSVTETDVNKEDTIYLNSETNQNSSKQRLQEKPHISSSSTVTSSQDISNSNQIVCSPPPKKLCNFEAEPFHSTTENGFSALGVGRSASVQPKVEIPDYLSDGDDDGREENDVEFSHELYGSREETDLQGGMDLLSPLTGYNKDMKHESSSQESRFHRRRLSEQWLAFNSRPIDDSPELSAILQNRQENDNGNRLVKLADGIEIYEDQLRAVKWSDYRKLTRGLATILFSPVELASCSVTGQRWSRAGSVERPVKPALDRAKVQAIISYVATRFPMVEISRIKQVLAYKCKENSTAFKMKAVRHYGEHFSK